MADSYTLAYRGTDVQTPVQRDAQGWLEAGVLTATQPRGAVTQITSNGTAVTLDKLAGQITCFGTLAAGAGATFIVNNKYVTENSAVTVSIQSITATAAATRDGATVQLVDTTDGTFHVHMFNPDANATTAAPIVHFSVAP